MTNVMFQDHFQPFAFLSDGGLNVHRHRRPVDTLVVFVHGLFGDGYATWEDFPRYMFESEMDVAIFDYPTGLDRTKRLRTPPPEASARLLSQDISDIEESYEHIILLGHSMGGLVAGLAAHLYFKDLQLNDGTRISPLAGLLTFASPLGGSLGMPIPISADLKFLSRRNRALRDFRNYAKDMIDLEISDYPNSNRYSFPIFSMSATNDFWVRRRNSTLGVPKHQAKDCGGTHAELVKPPTARHKSVRWSIQMIAKIRAMRARARRVSEGAMPATALDPGFRPGILVAKLCDTSEPAWVEAFTDALIFTEETYSLRVLDSRAANQSMNPDLVVHAVHASAVLIEPDRLRAEVIGEVTLHQDPSRTQVALGPTGLEFDEAVRSVHAWLKDARFHTSTWVEGVPDARGLRDQITKWLGVVAHAHLHTASSLPERRRTEALTSALETDSFGRGHDQPFGSGAW